MTELKDTKNLTEVVDLVLGVVDVVGKAEADGKIGFEDAVLLVQLIPLISPAIADIGELPSELADLHADEAAALVAHVMAKLSIEDAKARAVIEKSFGVLIAGFELVQAIKS